MPTDLWSDLITTLRSQLQPYGYCGHLLPYLEAKRNHLEAMIKRTVLMSESNSVLIIGARGSGKSTLLEVVLESISKNKNANDNMLCVHLDGMIHINDNLALEDITRQLRLEEIEDRSLGSFSEKLRQLLSALKSGTKESKSVLFVLDNFDLFCTHKNQHLMYNLFDVAQSQQTPICVVGMCSRTDVLQMLENRVNSRFSHQKILLFDEMTIDEYINAAKEFLTLSNFKDAHFRKNWNAQISHIFENQTVKNVLERRFDCSNSLTDLKELLHLVVQNVDESHPKLTAEDFESAYKHVIRDTKEAMILGLSVLELSLVVAMMHLTEIYDGEPFNFEIIYNELGRFLRNRMKWNIEKDVILKAFEHLTELELVKSNTDSSNNPLKRYMLVTLLVPPIRVREIVEQYQNLPVQLKHWAESAIDG